MSLWVKHVISSVSRESYCEWRIRILREVLLHLRDKSPYPIRRRSTFSKSLYPSPGNLEQ
jgi:hypothetical protein